MIFITFALNAQVFNYKPSDYRANTNYRKSSNLDGNNIRATIFNSGYSGNPDGSPNNIDYEWPKNTNRIYIALISIWIGGEVKDNNGDTIHLVEMPVYKSDPNGNSWNMEPVPGFVNPQQSQIARSDDKNSWPQDYQGGWRDKRADELDPGWPGSWDGFFGKNIFNADEEFFYVTSDDLYKRYPYTPDTTDPTRGGLGLIMDVRSLAWSQVLINDEVFFIHDIKNDGTKPIDKMAFMMFVADYVGGVGPTNFPYVDLQTAIAYLTSSDRVGNAAFGNDPVGVAGVKYIETPGNSVDGLDNDGDSDDHPELIAHIASPDTVIPHFTAEDFSPRTILPGDKIVLIEPTTYNRIITTYPQGGGKVYSLGKEYNLPPNGITVSEDTVANGYDDNFNGLIDEKSSIHLNHINEITGVVKPVRFINYLSFAVGNTIKRGFVVPGINAAWNYQNVAPMIDESRDDGFDNDDDWDPVLDDVGLDGVRGTGDSGEGDGKPTSGAGTDFPGEPDIDKTDVSESDQLGITTAVQVAVGQLNFSRAADNGLWDLVMVPGQINLLRQIGDYDLYVSSGYFPILPGQRQRMAVAIAIAGGGKTKNDDITSVTSKMHQADLAYAADYQFASAPKQVTVHAVAGNNQVTLYWDDFAEKSFDRYINKIGGNGHNFEGYRIYRATDAAFLDAKVITDGYGVKTLLSPIAQFDLKDGVKGFGQVDINGVKYYLGDDTGLKHMYVDKDVQNGQRYFYAVTAYNFGYEGANIPPAETPIQVNVSVDGSMSYGRNVAVVRPTASAAGYISPEVESFSHATGGASGSVGINVIDPNTIKSGNTYEITFTDTSYKVNNKDVITTKTFSLKNVSDNLYLLKDDTTVTSLAEIPVTEGFQISFNNVNDISLNNDKTSWNHPDIYSFDFEPVTFLNIKGVKSPNDYEIVFGDVGIATSKDTSIGFIKLPAVPVNFKVINLTQNKEIPFAFSEGDGSNGKFSINPSNSNQVDAIYLLEPNKNGVLQFTWQILLNLKEGSRNPQAGDTLKLILNKPFLSYDTYTFKMKGADISVEKAKTDLNNIRVVPNPYIAAETWEPRNTYSSGRGPREIAAVENGTEIWDVLSDEKFEVSYGVYVYFIDAPGIGQKTGTFAIIK
ncbi:MAG: hypothetical protein P8Z35_08855 [Ignavibacteriaceae bacterium]